MSMRGRQRRKVFLEDRAKLISFIRYMMYTSKLAFITGNIKASDGFAWQAGHKAVSLVKLANTLTEADHEIILKKDLTRS